LSALASAHRAAFNAVQEQTAMALPALPIETLDDIAERIRQRANGTRCDAIGLDLIEAKAILPHGKWLRWLKNELVRTNGAALHTGRRTRQNRQIVGFVGRALVRARQRASRCPNKIIDQTPAGQPITVAFVRKTKDAQSTAVPVTITRVEQRHSTPTPVMNARESARQYAEELKAKRDAKNAADIAEYQAKREAYKTPENWRVNAVDAAKNAIDLPDFWTAVYGEKWRHFAADDEIVALAQQAADTWAEIAQQLHTMSN
jgi:hypothetical protein